jgi:hypothetical protein
VCNATATGCGQKLTALVLVLECACWNARVGMHVLECTCWNAFGPLLAGCLVGQTDVRTHISPLHTRMRGPNVGVAVGMFGCTFAFVFIVRAGEYSVSSGAPSLRLAG